MTTVTEQLADLGLDGAQILDETRAFIRTFVVPPDDHSLAAITLWAAHAHLVENFFTSPRLALLSPEPASGKSRVLEVLALLVPEPMHSLSASPAAIFRSLEQRMVTLLFDEVDAIWNKRGQDDNHEDLRALLNAGYRKGATIPRCVGPRHEVSNFHVFCAVALAGLGDLPDTLMSRALIIRMRRRAPGEDCEPFRARQHEPLGHAIRRKLESWASVVGPRVGDAWPELPAGITDRPGELWEPLIAIADAAGGHWAATARAACVHLCRVAEDRRVSLGIRLLADLRTIFGDAVAMHTETIIEKLVAGEASGLDADSPWDNLHGAAVGKRGLATMLSKYGVKPQKVTVHGRSLQGYRREHLWDAWTRYLPTLSPPSGLPELPELAEQIPAIAVPAIPDIPRIRQGEGDSRQGAPGPDCPF